MISRPRPLKDDKNGILIFNRWHLPPIICKVTTTTTTTTKKQIHKWLSLKSDTKKWKDYTSARVSTWLSSLFTRRQSSRLENPMGGGAWWAAVHGAAKCRTWLSDFTFTFHFHVLEKEMATHSRVLAWRIPGTGKPARLPSMGLHRVRHDWSDLAEQQQSLS